jgi:HK97 family phage prohead protease
MEILNRNEEQREIEEALLIREFVAADLEVKGRTVDVRVVPFEEVATVSDPPYETTYREQWMPGVFDHQINAANRIHARYGHSQHVIDVVGHGISLRQEGDGYHVSAKIHDTPQGATALELLRDGALPCVSLEAVPVKSMRSVAGIVQRLKANLTGFAFCRQGAFAGAQVLAVREATVIDELAEEFQLPDIDPDLVARVRGLGIQLPARFEAHPAETDTPEASGTPAEDGTRHTPEAHDTEV